MPAEPRYLYPAGLWLAVVVAEVARPFLPRGRALVLVVGLLAIGVVANASHIAKGGAKMRGLAGITKSYLTAAEVYGPELTGPSMRPDPGQPQIYAGRYFDAVERYGSSVGYSAAELRGGSPALRKAVDEALLHVIPPTPEQAQAKPAAARDCRRAPAGGELFYDVPPKGVYLRAGDAQIELNMRRFGDTLLSIPPIAPGTEALVTRRPDRSSQRWELQARSAAPFEACLAG